VAYGIAHGRSVVLHWLLIGLVGLPLSMFTALLLSLARGTGRWTAWIWVRGSSAFGAAGALALLFLTSRLTVSTAVAATLLLGWASGVFLIPSLRDAGRPLVVPSLLREGIRYGLRAWLTGIASLANQHVDQVVMAGLVPSRELGLYAVAVTIASASSAFSSSIGVSLLPRVAAEGTAGVPRVLRLSLLIVAAAGLAVAAITAPLIRLLLGATFGAAVPMVWILIVGSIPLAGTAVLSQAFLGVGAPGAAARAEAIALAITVPGLAAFARDGGVAAATVSLAAYSVGFCYLARRASKDFGIELGELLWPRAADLRSLRTELRRQAAKLMRHHHAGESG
jgi:O-antigen/teichoic acid export membrane protein